MRFPRRLRLGLALALIALVACEAPSDGSPDAAVDGGPLPECDAPVAFETGDPTGHPSPLGASATEARAGRIEEGELPADHTGLALYAAGDFVLANDRIALLIEDVGESDIYDRYGGRPIGIARVEGGALVSQGDFGEIIFGLGGNIVATESVTVMADGSDGGAAVVRVTGPLVSIDFLGSLLPDALRGDFDGWPAAIDYRLEPGAERVEITVTVDQISPRTMRVPLQLDGFVQNYRMPLWTAADGFGTVSGDTPWIAFDDPVGASYAWEAPEGSVLRLLVESTGIVVVSSGTIALPPCSRIEVPIGSIAIGARLNPAQALAWRRDGTALRAISGAVRESDGSAASGVRVHATRPDGTHLTRGLIDADGAFSLEVPDEDVQLWAFRQGTPVVGPIALPRASATAMIDMPALGTIEVSVRDATSATALPSRVQVLPMTGDVARPPASWGEPEIAGGRAHVEFAGASGLVSMRVPAGEWRVIVSRGYEYELALQTVAVVAGETVTVDAELLRSVDTIGVMCADYHIHTSRSPDSPDDAGFKVMGLVADGLELAVRSDHDFVAAFDPVVTELGLEAFALGISGEELTTFTYGHFGVFPLVPDASRRNAGAPRWTGRLAPDVFAELRARPEQPALIVNHPRTGGTFGGYFTAAGYDADTGTVSHMEQWDEAFSVVEVFNDSGFESNRDRTVHDWFSFLRSGRRVFAVGSSDSHRIQGAPVGYPRTCIALGTDDPRAVTPEQVRDATVAGSSYVSGGIFLDVEGAGGIGPGGEIVGAGERAALRVVVRAATWIGVDALEVIVDGVTTELIPIGPDDGDPTDATIRLDAMIEAPVAPAGSFVVIVASGSGDLAPVHPGRGPFAVSNPIFLRR